MENPVVGIDLGTTYSSIAFVDEQGRPRAIPNAQGKNSTPSAVLIQDGHIAVGDIALNEWITNEEHVVRWIKRAMGNPGYRFQGLSPIEVSAEILKALKQDAETHFGEEVREAVITCPAYFAAIEIENTQAAGELANLHVREIVKEPTAAAVYYGIDNMRDGEKVLVCDLGGGTFDATVLALENGVFIPLASMGDRELGGHDWTMELREMVADQFQERFGDDPRNDIVAAQQLYENCEQAKRDLARLSQVTIACSYHGRMEQIQVTRQEFESRTEWRIQQLIMWCQRALEKARPVLTWATLDRILLVGGSSRLRRMALALQEASGKAPVQTGEPDLMVALGAAILARGQVRRRRPVSNLLEDHRSSLIEVDFKRVNTRSLGTRAVIFDGNQGRITNSLIIPHGTESPVSRSREDFEIATHGQALFDVPVVEFEGDDDYEVVGNYRFSCRPNTRRGDRIRVVFSYDLSGIVKVEAFECKSGSALPGERLPYQEPDATQVGRARVRPRWVIFAVDTSYSMQGAKIKAAIQGVVDNARALLAVGGDGCKVGVVAFSAQAEVACTPTSDLALIERAANGLRPQSTTAMDVGILEAVRLAMSAPDGADRDIVVLTDGMPDAERRSQTLHAAKECASKGITLSSLGVGKDDVDLTFLNQLTPLALVIESAGETGVAMTTLLAQSAAARGGLTDKF